MAERILINLTINRDKVENLILRIEPTNVLKSLQDRNSEIEIISMKPANEFFWSKECEQRFDNAYQKRTSRSGISKLRKASKSQFEFSDSENRASTGGLTEFLLALNKESRLKKRRLSKSRQQLLNKIKKHYK